MKKLVLLIVSVQAFDLPLTSAVEWEFVTVPLTSGQPFLLVELLRNPAFPSRELLTADYDTSPIVYRNTSGVWEITRNFSNVETWAHHESYHFLQIPCSRTSVIVGAYFELSLDHSLYHFTATFHDGSKCPNDCSGHGTCELGSCQCTSGWAGGHCLYPVVEATYGSPYEVNNTFELTTKGASGVELQVVDGGEVTVCLLEEREYLVPSSDYCTRSFHSLQGYVYIPVLTSPLYLLLNSSLASVVFSSVQPGSSESSPLTYILVGVLVPVTVLFLVLTALVLFFRTRRRPQLNANPTLPLTQRHTQLMEQLNLTSPVKKYGALTTHYSSECAVCLEAFGKESEVRRLDCGHVYHSTCLESLVTRQQNCCVCKQSFEGKLNTSYLTTLGDSTQARD